MAALTPNERCFVLESYIFFLLIKTEQAKSGTSAATYKVLEIHWIASLSCSMESSQWRLVERGSSLVAIIVEPVSTDFGVLANCADF